MAIYYVPLRGGGLAGTRTQITPACVGLLLPIELQGLIAAGFPAALGGPTLARSSLYPPVYLAGKHGAQTAKALIPGCKTPSALVPDYPPVRGGLCQLSLGSNRRRSVVAVEGTAGIEPAHPSCACRGCSEAMPILAPLPHALPTGVLFGFWGDRNRTGLLMQRIAPTERGNGTRTPEFYVPAPRKISGCRWA